jgi:catechol 2,3-dioxygenase-like lactoylglutathione lyase family enzyme
MDQSGSPVSIELSTVALDSADKEALADFYLRMLGWKLTYKDENWIDIQSPDGGVKLGFQDDPDYAPPAWPGGPGDQMQMLHLDFKVRDAEQMARAVEHAVACGAAKAETQYSDGWTVMLDPAGHPFCFVC